MNVSGPDFQVTLSHKLHNFKNARVGKWPDTTLWKALWRPHQTSKFLLRKEWLTWPSLKESNKWKWQWRKRPRTDLKCPFPPRFIFLTRRSTGRCVERVPTQAGHMGRQWPSHGHLAVEEGNHAWKASRAPFSFWTRWLLSFSVYSTALKIIHYISHEAGEKTDLLFSLCFQILIQVTWLETTVSFFQG